MSQLISYVGNGDEPPPFSGLYTYAPIKSHKDMASPHIIPAIAPYILKLKNKMIIH